VRGRIHSPHGGLQGSCGAAELGAVSCCEHRPGETDRQTDRQTDGHTNRETDRQRDRQTDRQTDGQTDRRTDGQTDRQTDGSRHRLIPPYWGHNKLFAFIILILLV